MATWRHPSEGFPDWQEQLEPLRRILRRWGRGRVVWLALVVVLLLWLVSGFYVVRPAERADLQPAPAGRGGRPGHGGHGTGLRPGRGVLRLPAAPGNLRAHLRRRQHDDPPAPRLGPAPLPGEPAAAAVTGPGPPASSRGRRDEADQMPEASWEEDMTTPDPGVRQAVNWIAERMRENADANRLALIDEASQRFGLSPLQIDFLYRQFLSPAPPPAPPGGVPEA